MLIPCYKVCFQTKLHTTNYVSNPSGQLRALHVAHYFYLCKTVSMDKKVAASTRHFDCSQIPYNSSEIWGKKNRPKKAALLSTVPELQLKWEKKNQGEMVSRLQGKKQIKPQAACYSLMTFFSNGNRSLPSSPFLSFLVIYDECFQTVGSLGASLSPPYPLS